MTHVHTDTYMTRTVLSRRQMIAALSAMGLSSCLSVSERDAALRRGHPLDTDMSLIKHSVIGLRPGRQSGFRLDVETREDKTIVHNYGHGGDGVSVSWPCGNWAADQVSRTGLSDVVVIGAGVSGLTTAWILARRGASVTLYADQFSPNTTSNIAGAKILSAPSYRSSSNMTGPSDAEINAKMNDGFIPFVNQPRYGVYWLDHYQLGTASQKKDSFLGRSVSDSFRALMVDPSHYLPALMQDLKDMGAVFVTRKFSVIDEITQLPQKIMVNCTGLGAGTLFEDRAIFPIRGQLTVLNAQREIDYSYIARQPGGVLYMFPRRDAIVLGGTHQRGNDSLIVDDAETLRQIQGHRQLANAFSNRPAVVREFANQTA